MTNIAFIILAAMLGAIVFFIMEERRSDKVIRYRAGLIEKIYQERTAAIFEQREPTLSWEVLRSVTYGDMMRQWRRPCEDFFPPEYRL